MDRQARERGREADSVEKESWSYALLSRQRGELMGLAMLWVLLYHCFAWRPKWSWLYAVKGAGFCGVDIFLLLSGLGLALSLCKREQRYGDYLKRRLVRVLPAYWLAAGGYGLALRLAGRTSLKTVAWTVSTLYYWLGKPHCFNWYVPALLGFYLLTPPLVALLRKVKWPQAVAAAAWAACLVIYHWISIPIPEEVRGGFVMRLPIFLMGCMIGAWLTQGRGLTAKRTALWCALPLLAVPLSWAIRPYYVPLGFWFALVCVPLCLGLAWLLERLPKGGLRRVLREIGGASLEIYLLNVIFVLERPLLERVVPMGPNYLAFYTVTVPANILLGIGLHYVLDRPLGWLKKKLLSEG